MTHSDFNESNPPPIDQPPPGTPEVPPDVRSGIENINVNGNDSSATPSTGSENQLPSGWEGTRLY